MGCAQQKPRRPNRDLGKLQMQRNNSPEKMDSKIKDQSKDVTKYSPSMVQQKRSKIRHTLDEGQFVPPSITVPTFKVSG